MQHPIRDYTRTKFSEYLGTGALSRNCERNVLNWAVKQTYGTSSWENKLFKERYKMKVHALLAEFKRLSYVKVGLTVEGDKVSVKLHLVPSQLADRLLKKELDSTKLAFYTADILDPNGPYSQAIFRNKKKDNDMEAKKATENEDYVGQFKCGKCKSVKTTYYQLQTRSADEPMVSFIIILFLFVF
jgi:DNA-directed RNA polymerase subunit M/transcription elongation factor TFIIS